MQQPPLPRTAIRSSLRRRDWLIVGGITLGTITGVGLIALAAAIAVHVVPAPSYQQGVTTGDLAAVVAAGATLLLADFTALLAWVKDLAREL